MFWDSNQDFLVLFFSNLKGPFLQFSVFLVIFGLQFSVFLVVFGLQFSVFDPIILLRGDKNVKKKSRKQTYILAQQ